jgi:Fur family transcriptional regulator, zinc uptake regulator
MNIETALNLLKDKGYKYTGKRETMVRMFANEKKYMSAKDVLERMHTEYPQLSFDTIYRNLALFESLGILESTELKGEKQYRFRCPGSDHHHHIICTKCGKTKMIEVCPMNDTFDIPDDFSVMEHKFEIYGLCRECE